MHCHLRRGKNYVTEVEKSFNGHIVLSHQLYRLWGFDQFHGGLVCQFEKGYVGKEISQRKRTMDDRPAAPVGRYNINKKRVPLIMRILKWSLLFLFTFTLVCWFRVSLISGAEDGTANVWTLFWKHWVFIKNNSKVMFNEQPDSRCCYLTRQ